MDPTKIGNSNFLGLTRNINPIAQPSAEGTQQTGVKPFAPQKTDTYGQYDRAFEHGYGGVHYGSNGELLGQKLNFEA